MKKGKGEGNNKRETIQKVDTEIFVAVRWRSLVFVGVRWCFAASCGARRRPCVRKRWYRRTLWQRAALSNADIDVIALAVGGGSGGGGVGSGGCGGGPSRSDLSGVGAAVEEDGLLQPCKALEAGALHDQEGCGKASW